LIRFLDENAWEMWEEKTVLALALGGITQKKEEKCWIFEQLERAIQEKRLEKKMTATYGWASYNKKKEDEGQGEEEEEDEENKNKLKEKIKKIEAYKEKWILPEMNGNAEYLLEKKNGTVEAIEGNGELGRVMGKNIE